MDDEAEPVTCGMTKLDRMGIDGDAEGGFEPVPNFIGADAAIITSAAGGGLRLKADHTEDTGLLEEPLDDVVELVEIFTVDGDGKRDIERLAGAFANALNKRDHAVTDLIELEFGFGF